MAVDVAVSAQAPALDPPLQQLLDAAARAVPGVNPDELTPLLTLFYGQTPASELAGRDPAALAAAVQAHVSLAGTRGPDEIHVHVGEPGQDALSPQGSAVQVVCTDMAFLVDSVTAELARLGCAIALVLHPIVRVQRDAHGELESLGTGEPESWMHLEVQGIQGADERTVVAERVRSVLLDVAAAVADNAKMTTTATALAERLDVHELQPMGERGAELLRWLTQEDGTLLGYATYVLPEGADELEPVAGSELGLLRRHSAGPDGPVGQVLPPRADEAQRLVVVSKAPDRSTVQRPAYLDSVAVRLDDDRGRRIEHHFLCLFAPSAYTESVLRIPVVRHRAQEIMRRAAFSPRSYSGRDLLQILETYPRDELFQASVTDLARVTDEVLHLRERRRLRLFLRRDADASYLSCLVYLPRDRYTRDVRQTMEQVLRETFEASSVEYTVRVTESVLARIHFVVRPERGRQLPDIDAEALERRLVEVARSWDDALAEALRDLVDDAEADRLLRSHEQMFPEAYKEDFSPVAGAADVVRVAALDGEPLSMYLARTRSGELHFKVASRAEMSLSAVLPVLTDMGVEVLQARPYGLHRVDAHLYDFILRVTGRDRLAEEGVAEQFQETFQAAWQGRVESDGFNALVVGGGLRCRQVVVLRAYAKYLRQGGWSFTPSYVEQCLTAQDVLAAQLVALFEAQFDPAGDDGTRDVRADELAQVCEQALAEVPSLDQDRILRAILRAIRATVRTNHYQRGADGQAKTWLSLKLLPADIPGLPDPRPEREIWVYSPAVEGVHLRFGAVARGGLRWSDRREDFRTEVLGLVKAQVVKNAVIVPVGAKGGFVAKRLPDPADGREAWQAEGLECYRTFIRGLLDLTDNLVEGQVVPPTDVVRRDDDDTYLVVAADKGTATFSDTANEVAAEYDFWLGDAFASGGSVGYDHKAMGITARGAWEAVRRHFRELDVDVDTDPVTVVGIGDMSGDVFGNGMLLSRSLRVVAAFDHRHIFLDPDPDPATSYAERARLFALPRSSWQDYDASLLSAGGAVVSRTAKSVSVSPQVRERLGLTTDRLTPSELLTAILRAPVDLLWNGGIGTWVKASTESHAEAGDKANDAVRVDGRDLRCRVVGEGGNLGLTQRGRIEAALAGVRLNTDAIDNSAGVDCSDHEVNIKILLDAVVAEGGLTSGERDALLGEMTDEVAELVLRHNRAQNALLSNARHQARAMAPVHRRYLRQLESTGALDRALEALPDDSELEARWVAGGGLSSPEFAVVTAYAKNTVKIALLASGLPDEPWYEKHLRDYFPAQLSRWYAEQLHSHPLRREIVTTSVVNELVDQGGTSMVFRAGEETGARTDEVVRAYTVATEVFELRERWAEIADLDAPVPLQVSLHLEARRLVDRVVRRQLADGGRVLDVAADVERYGPTVAALLPQVPDLVGGSEREVLHGGVARREQQGVPTALARSLVSLLHGFVLLDVVDLALSSGQPAGEVARLHYRLSAGFAVDTQLGRVTDLPRTDRWQALARSALRDDLYAALARLTADVLATTEPGEPVDRIAAWEQAHESSVTAARARLQEIESGEVFDLAAMSVVVRTLRGVLPLR